MPVCRPSRQHGLHVDLDLPRGVHERRDHGRVHGTNLGEELAVGARHSLEVLRVGHIDARPKDVLAPCRARPARYAAAGLVTGDGRVETPGDLPRVLRLPSVSKPVAALAFLVAAEEG